MVEAPRRIQLSRAKGWKLPANAVSVARPGRWGNPFWDLPVLGRSRAIALFREAMMGGWSPSNIDGLSDEVAARVYADHCAWIKRTGWPFPIDGARAELRGQHLGCWCKLTDACHADVLLELANPPPPGSGSR